MRLLAVEDNPDILNILRLSLTGAGFSVDTAEDGEQGSALALASDYDLIVLDNMLPKKNGAEVCRDIRGAGKTVPILVLSALSDVSDKTSLLDAGADDYLTKPYSFDELLARIRALLRRPQQIEESVFRVGDLELDVNRRTCTKGGTEITLTRKEFLLLEYLLRNAGTVCSRGSIMGHIWGTDADPTSNIIETHIMSLRKKIGGEEGSKFVVTVPGFGYKITPTEK